MTFVLPSTNNNFTVSPATNARWIATTGAPTSAGVKTAGGLPITSNVGDWERASSVAGLQGYTYEFLATGGYDVSVDTRLMLWHNQSNAPNRVQKDSTANSGNQIRIYSGGNGSLSTNWRGFYVGGNDTPMNATIAGQYPTVIDLNAVGHDASNGSFVNTDVQQYAWLCEPFQMAGGSTMWNYPGQVRVVETTKAGSDTPTFIATSSFVDAVTLVQGTSFSNKIGNWVRQIGSVIFIDMAFRIGDNSTETDFNDNGLTIISPIDNDSADPRNRLTAQAMRAYLNLRNNAADTSIFSGTYIWGTRADFDFDQDDSAVVTFSRPTFRGMGGFTLGSSITGPATWDDVNPVVFADTGVNVDGSTFRNQNGLHALEMTAGAMDIADMRFESYASNHAILIDTPGTYNFDNVFFDESGTNDIETTHASGVVTINISNGGTVPGVTVTGAGTVVVNNNVTISVTVTDTSGTAIQSARVRLVADESVGTITAGDIILTGLTNASGLLETTTFNYEASFNPTGLDCLLTVRQASVAPYKKPLENGLITITIAGSISTVALVSDE